jgi:hypothetical protein
MNRFRCTDLGLVEALPMRFYPKLRAGHVLNNASAKFERHSQHNPKGLMPLGAYSYSHSVFNADWIGRYCSISENVRVMGASHPHHWVTTSPVQYQPRRRFDLPPCLTLPGMMARHGLCVSVMTFGLAKMCCCVMVYPSAMAR